MKKRKILYLFPLAALVLSGCTIQEGWDIAKNWTVDSVYTPAKDFIMKLLGKEQKKEEKPGEDQKPSGGDQGGDQGGEQGGGDQGGGGGTDVVHVTGIRYDTHGVYQVEVGGTLKIDITVEPEDATNKAVTFVSDHPELATVDETGLVTGIKGGYVKITMTSVDNPEATKTLSLTVHEEAAGLPASTAGGYTKLLKGESLEDGEKVNIAGAIAEKFYAMPHYSEGNNIKAKEVALNENKLNIAASDEFEVVLNQDKTYSFKQTDTTDTSEKVAYLAALGGSSSNYLKTVNEIDDTAKFTISVDDDGYALVKAGTVGRGTMCLNPNSGNPIFSCYNEQKFEKFAIYHEGSKTPTVTEVTLSETHLDLEVGKPDATLTATVVGENNPSQEITWDSDNKSVATVNNGVVHAVAEGTANITATSVLDPTKSKICTVTVTEPEQPVVLESIEVTKSPTTVKYVVGDALDLSGMEVMAHYSDNTSVPVTTWTSVPTAGAVLTAQDTSLVVSFEGKSAEPIALSVGTLSSVSVKTQPKTEYTEGELLDLTGMVLTLTYSNELTREVTEGWTTNIAADHELTTSDTSLVVSYGGVSADPITLIVSEKPQLLVEEIKAEDLGLIKSYGNFSTVLSVSGFLMQGNAMTNDAEEIQFRTLNDGSGIYTRNSSRNIRSIKFNFTATNKGKTVTVYGQNEAYTAPSTDGVSLGTVSAKTDTASVETLNITGNYRNFCITSNGATYLSSMELSWDESAAPMSVASVSLNLSTASVGAGETLELTSIVDGVGNSQNVIWESDDTDIATVVDGVVTGVAAGSTKIRAKASDDQSKFAECTVTVTTTQTLKSADFTLKTTAHSKYDDGPWDYNDDFSVDVGANNNGGWAFVKLGIKSGTSGQAKTSVGKITSVAVNHTVANVVVDIESGSLAKTGMEVTEWGVLVKKNDVQVDKVVSNTAITKNAAKVTLIPTTGDTWEAGCTFEVYFNCSNSSTTNGVVCVKKVAIVG